LVPAIRWIPSGKKSAVRRAQLLKFQPPVFRYYYIGKQAMNLQSHADRRVHRRRPAPASVRVEHLASHRQFPARAVDASAGGMLMYVPATTPVKVGQTIRLAINDVAPPDLAGLAGADLPATIRRVDRHALINVGHLAIGVEFDQPIEA
jgi:c-di-GMP-binding flagellar brake protein YcgR